MKNINELRVLPDVKRIIPIKEVKTHNHYEDMAKLAVIFNHDIIETDGGVWRWKENRLTRLMQEYCPVFTPCGLENEANGRDSYGRHCQECRASLSLNGLIVDLYDGYFSVEEYMKFYMQIGYSLCGFREVFGQREAAEFNLIGAKTEHDPYQDEDDYIETVIEYMLRIHKGEVLKI